MGISLAMKTEKSTYEKAHDEVKKMKDWYEHLYVYLTACVIFTLFILGLFDNGYISKYIPDLSLLVMVLGWGIGLFIHWLYAFKKIYRIQQGIKRWEDRKIKEFMNNENHHLE